MLQLMREGCLYTYPPLSIVSYSFIQLSEEEQCIVKTCAHGFNTAAQECRVVGSENNIVEGGRRRKDGAACRGISEQHRGRREKTEGRGSVSWDQITTSWKEGEDGRTGQRVVGSENNIVEGGRRRKDGAACRGIREQHRGRREKTEGRGSVSWDQITTSWKEGEDGRTGQRVVGSDNNIVEGGRRRKDGAACRGIR